MPGRLSQERLRRQYRPEQVRLLFIGESPPASGRFFYQRDSGLYRAFRDAFRTINPAIEDANFLETFRALGCYLIDLCPYPVDRLDPPDRRAAWQANETRLSRLIAGLRPERVATIVRGIRGNVERAVARAGWNGPILDLPYPGRWARHRTVFLSRLAPELTPLSQPSSPPK